MRYLKTFENHTDDELVYECRQILADVSDDGVTVNIEHKYKHPFLSITVTLGNRKFDPEKYIDSFEHLNSYLNSKRYRYDSNGTAYTTWGKKINSFKEGNVLLLMQSVWTRELKDLRKRYWRG
jgi:hypothetical protein